MQLLCSEGFLVAEMYHCGACCERPWSSGGTGVAWQATILGATLRRKSAFRKAPGRRVDVFFVYTAE